MSYHRDPGRDAAADYPEIPPLADVVQAAAILNISTRKCRELIANRKIGCVRIGVLVRVPRHELIAVIRGDNTEVSK